MQPNGQYQPPAPNPNIPEYLHMDPVVDPIIGLQKKKKRKTVLRLMIGVVLLIAILASTVYWYLTMNSPQQKLYRALEKNLQVNYIVRDYSLKSTSPKRENSYKVETDFSSSVQPKSHLTYVDSKTSNDSTVVTYQGEKIILDQNDYFSIVTSAVPKAAADGQALNQWQNTPLKTTDSYFFDGIDSLQGLNSIQGVLLTGNFNDEQRKELMGVIRSQDMYTVTTYNDLADGGRKLTDYTVSVDLEKINNLNKKALSLIGASRSLTIAKTKTESGELHILVDEASGQIAKVKYLIKSKEAVTFQKVVTINYPSTLSIEKPAIVNNVTSSGK